MDPIIPETGADAMALRKPDFTKNQANMHYMSESTGEVGCIVFRRGQTSIEDIFRQYCRQFPLEAKLFAEEVKSVNQQLVNSKGMSIGGRMMSIAKIPDIIMTACKYLYGENYWDDKKNTLDFIRQNPGFMIGDHSRKEHGNIIIK